jgi:autotransporter-associated beta strand protein
VAVNYGGILTQSAAFNPSNTITVNAGGTYYANGNTAYSTVTVNSMGVISGGTVFAGTLPSAGALFAALSTPNAYPSLTGTMTFGGEGVFTVNGAALMLSSSAGAARTIAFNTSGSGTTFTAFTNGLTLNANLTIAGSGNTGLTGLVSSGAAGNLNTVTESGSGRSLTIAMIPTGAVSINAGSTYSGDTVIQSGTLYMGSVNGRRLPNSSLKLDGGALRIACDNVTTTDPISVLSPSTIEAGGGDNTATTLSGNISGSSRLTLRTGVFRTQGPGIVVINGDNSATGGNFTGGFRLEYINWLNSFRFNSANSLGAGGAGSIDVPQGVTFGVNFNPDATAAAKFSFASNGESLFDPNSRTSGLNLNTLGWDVRLGPMQGGPSDLTGWTPYASTYKLTGTRRMGWTISTANSFIDASGPSARNLDIRPGAVSPGATELLGDAGITISAAQPYSGTTTISGVVKNVLMSGGVQGVGVTVSAGGLTGTSAITVDNAATLVLSGGTSGQAAGAAVTVRGSSIGILAAANVLDDDSILTLGDTRAIPTSGGGNCASAASATQTLASLMIGSGASTINPNATGKLTITNGTPTRSVAGGTASITSGNLVLSGNTSNAFLGAGFFVGNNFAATDASANVIAYTPNTNNINDGTNKRFQNTTGGGTYTLSAANTLQTINFNTNANDLSVATYALELTGGGIVNGSGAVRYINTDSGGSLTSSYNPGGSIRELIINDVNGLVIVPRIVQNNSANITLTKIGAGTTSLVHGSNQLGDIYINAGYIQSNTAGALTTASTDTIYLFGGGIAFTAGTNQSYSGRKLVVGPQGGKYTDGGTTAVSSLGGAVTLGGDLVIINQGDKTLGGPIGTSSGGGEGMIRYIYVTETVTGAGRLTLSGNNQYWSGGLHIGDGAMVRFAGANASGTGPIVIQASTDRGLGYGRSSIEFTGNTDGVRTVSNDFIGKYSAPYAVPRVPWFTIANAKTDAAVTLSGKIFADRGGGVSFQGYDNGSGGVSETVLSGIVSICGVPMPYNYAGPPSGSATSFQQFINGQGGITLGVTAYESTTAARAAYQTAGGFVPYGGSNNPVENGAEGYVRFAPDASGKVNSLIPGAVGPGYVAALRKGGATALNFGYLLTGTSGSGTTYRLPQGKSFVLGTLGSGTAQVGTLGATGSGTANLDGGTKHEASTGQLLAGLYGGDINIHGNASGDTASLNLLARDADTTLVLGNTSQVVFTPTWGDSGGRSCMTLMRHRSGNTTLRKTGLGTLVVKNTAYNQVSGTDARGTFTWQVDAGTLRYDQVDTGADYLGFNVNTGATLAGSGTINASVSVVSGTLNPGSATSPAALTMKSLTLNDSSAIVALDLAGDTAGTQYDQLVIPSGGDGAFLNNATLAIVLSYSPAVGKVFTIIDRQSAGAVTGVFNGLAEGATIASTGITRNFTISYVGGDGNDVTLTAQ